MEAGGFDRFSRKDNHFTIHDYVESPVIGEFLDTAEVPVVILSLDARVTFFNAAAAVLFGLESERVVRGSIDRSPVSRLFQEDADTLRLVLSSGERKTLHRRIVVGDRERTVSILLYPLQADGGSVLGLIALLHDLSQFRTPERAPGSNEETLEETIRLVNLGVFKHDQLTDTVEWSPRLREICGIAPDEPVSLERFISAVHPDDRRMVADSISHSHEPTGDGYWNAELRIVRPDRSVRWLAARSRTFFEDSPDGRRPVRTLGLLWDITDRKVAQEARDRSEEALRWSERHLAEAQRIARVGSWEWDMSSGRVTWSRELFVILGLEPSEHAPSVEDQEAIYTMESVDRMHAAMDKIMKDRIPYVIEMERPYPTGPSTWVLGRGEVVVDDGGNITGLWGTALDITESKRMESQLLQAQKMESVGLLAGGIAHDFNNLLTVVQGYLAMARTRHPEDQVLSEYFDGIAKAGSVAASLTQQLLAFSRKQIIDPRVLDPNALISQALKMLGRIVGEDIQLRTKLDPDVWKIEIDPIQGEQVIMNLAANARDAMPSGGRLTFETANVSLDEAYASSHVDVVPGDYVMLAISDTGAGIEKDVLAHIFDPFFTTKESGKGTGLGLAVVYGAVRQNGGTIEVYSEYGLGATFRVYFPRSSGEAESGEPQSSDPSLSGTETIFIVEDDADIRTVASLILERKGYDIHVFPDGPSAIAAAKASKEPIHLLVTDVVMPRMTGKAVADTFAAIRPDIRILYASGYTADVIHRQGIVKEGVDFLAKPYTGDLLCRRIREVLDR